MLIIKKDGFAPIDIKKVAGLSLKKGIIPPFLTVNLEGDGLVLGIEFCDEEYDTAGEISFDICFPPDKINSGMAAVDLRLLVGHSCESEWIIESAISQALAPFVTLEILEIKEYEYYDAIILFTLSIHLPRSIWVVEAEYPKSEVENFLIVDTS